MIRDHFRVLKVDLSTGRGQIEEIEGRNACAGGSGLAALLFGRMGFSNRGWEDPEQSLIFTIGPLTGYFPLMSKVVCAFKQVVTWKGPMDMNYMDSLQNDYAQTIRNLCV